MTLVRQIKELVGQFSYWGFLLGIPMCARNRCMGSVYGVVGPFAVVTERRLRFGLNLDVSNSLFSTLL